MTSDRVGILTFEQMQSEQDLGSTRIRALSMVEYWPEAELFQMGQRYSTVIFQKTYWLEYVKMFDGVKILDLCDPDLLHWGSPCKAMADACDVVTTSTLALANLVSQYTTTPTSYVPDRVNFNSIRGLRKAHSGNGPTRTAVWFGYSMNFPSLDSAIAMLHPLGINHLIVIADWDKPYWLPLEHYGTMRVTNYAWQAKTVHEHLLEADIVLNFSLDSGRWKYKSNNKTILAWALGLPVARSVDELASLISEDTRIQEAERRLLEVQRDYDIRQSVDEYKSLIARVSAPKIGLPVLPNRKGTLSDGTEHNQ
jgi:hypothetical protein